MSCELVRREGLDLEYGRRHCESMTTYGTHIAGYPTRPAKTQTISASAKIRSAGSPCHDSPRTTSVDKDLLILLGKDLRESIHQRLGDGVGQLRSSPAGFLDSTFFDSSLATQSSLAH
jgi:hypothetical protein